MIVCIPVTSSEEVGPGFGRASRVAIADVAGGQVTSWKVFDVGWGELHDAGTEGSHHARIAQFIRDHGVAMVVGSHMGEGMLRVLGRMGVDVHMGASGGARAAVLAAVDGGRDLSPDSDPTR